MTSPTVPLRSSLGRTLSTHHWSVRTLLIWLVLACLLPGVLGAAALFAYQYREGRAEQDADAVRMSHAITQAVDGHLRSAQAVAQALSTARELEQNDLAQFHRRAREAIARTGLGNNVTLRDPSGRLVLNTLVEFGQPLAHAVAPELVREVFEEGSPHISDVFFGPIIQRPVVSLLVPVRIGDGIRYALGVVIPAEHFTALLQAQSVPPDWVVGIFDRSGTIVGRTHSPELVGTAGPRELLDAMEKSREGTIDLTTIEGTAVVSSFTRSTLTGWKVAIGIPRAANEGALVRTLAMLALGVAALFGIGLLLARFMSQRIVRSVQALTGPAVALGSGVAIAAPQVHIKEVADVAAAIERAAELLRERAATLEARDAELAEAHRLARFGSWHWNLATGDIETSESIRNIFGPIPSFPEMRGTLLTVASWERMNAAAQEAVRTGRGGDLELEANPPEGVPMWISSKFETIRDNDGKVVALRGVMLDVTEQKRAAEHVRESEARFRLLADNIAQLTWMADEDGWIFWYNQRWFDYTGTTPEEVRGWGWQKLLHPEYADGVTAGIRRCFETGESWEDTFPLRRADGKYRWFLSRAIPQRNEAGRVLRWFGTHTDVTDQREVDEELRKFKLFSDYSNDIHMLLDAAGRIRYVNKRACVHLGYSEAELLKLHIADIDLEYREERFRELFERSKRVSVPFELLNRRKNGSTVPVEVMATVLEFHGEWLMFKTSRDITERKLAEQRIIAAALHDPLTGLPNRTSVFEYGGHLLAGAQRSHAQGALLFIDLDRFKPINDTYGHQVGDGVLKEVARRLGACTRHEDMVGRLGGDEFVILLSHLDPGQHRAAAVAQHVIDDLIRPIRVDELELSISPSIGISYFPENATDVSTLIHTADLAMYQAKRAGRAHYHFYTPELERRADEVLLLETRLKNALEHDGLELHYQPVIDIRSGKLISAEALLRLADDGNEPVGPGRFIPVAESAGLIGELGEWVAAEACRQHDAWLSQGLRVTIAINVSPLQLRQRTFANHLGKIVADSGIEPNGLQIEVTESAVMESIDDAVAILSRLKSFGIKVALDDFGTGHSSLSSLSSLPLDKIKVDQSFVHQIASNPRNRAITKAVIALGHALNLEIVGEGIESAEALQYLRNEGCDHAQGFWFSEPLPAAEFAQWCRSRTLH